MNPSRYHERRASETSESVPKCLVSSVSMGVCLSCGMILRNGNVSD